MTLTELKYIVAVARVKHFGKAADECFVSQPTLSLGIRKLEDGLGVTIFERGRSEVRITPVGQAIINQAQNVLAEAEVIKSIAVADKHQLRDPIKIASSFTIGKYLFPHLIKQIYNFTPELLVSLSQDYHDKLITKLLNKELDLLILSTNVLSDDSSVALDDFNHCLNNQDLCFQPVLKEELYLLASKNNKHSMADMFTIEKINFDEILLLNQQHCLHSQALAFNPIWYEQWLQNKNKMKNYNLDSLESLQDQVVLESGLTIIPAMFSLDLKQKNNESFTVIYPENDSQDNRAPSRILSLVWRSDFQRMQVIEMFKHVLKDINLPGVRVLLS